MVLTCVPCTVCVVLARVSSVACLFLKVCQCQMFVQALMECNNEEPQTPQPTRASSVGGTVHVYNGTSAGTRGYNTVAYIGTVVGFDVEHKKWLVRYVLRLRIFFV